MIDLSTYLSVFLYITDLFTYLSIYLSTKFLYLFIYLSIHLSIHLFVYKIYTYIHLSSFLFISKKKFGMIDYNNLILSNTRLKGRSFNKILFEKDYPFKYIMCLYIICTVCPNKRLDVCTGFSNKTKKIQYKNIMKIIFSQILLKQGLKRP